MLLALLLAQAAAAQSTGRTQADARAPSAIVAAAPAADWVAIAADDLLVMELAPDTQGRARRVVIQLMPPPFSQGWVANIRTLARAHWWDGLSVNRVQDNYVAQWGDADAEDKAKAKPLPAGLRTMTEREYELPARAAPVAGFSPARIDPRYLPAQRAYGNESTLDAMSDTRPNFASFDARRRATWTEPYAAYVGHLKGWPYASDFETYWPVHCYAAVGVGRNLSPDTGSGAELYTVIGHTPRHLDRNIALVGRVVEGIEQLSSLPRGTEALGFYKTSAERTAIRSVRLASELPAGERPRLQYRSTESASFAAYANARANRHDEFFIHPAGGADVCNIPVPVRRVAPPSSRP